MVNLEPALFFCAGNVVSIPRIPRAQNTFFYLHCFFLFFYLENHRVGFLFHADKYIIVVLCVQCCQ